MLKKTITKKFSFVIFFVIIGGLFSACSSAISSRTANDDAAKKKTAQWSEPEIVGTIKTGEITESSGLVASRCQPNVFWTHNDSGDDAFIFALNEQGVKLGTWKVSGAKNKDWEDIAAFQDKKTGKCFLYIGDIGNNERLKSEMTIYRISEPKVSAADNNSSVKNPADTENAEVIKFNYPDLRQDAETLMVQPNTGDIYVLSKNLTGAAGVYKLAAGYNLEKVNTLEKIADFSVPAIPNGFLTGGDISPDGRHVVICDYFSAYEIVLPAKSQNFDEIWKEKPEIVELGERKQGEAAAYSVDGNSIFATSEKKNSPLIKVIRKY